MTTTAFTQGYASGYAEAVERHHIGDATDASDASTWFTTPPGQPDVEEYERGFLTGFADYLHNSRPDRP